MSRKRLGPYCPYCHNDTGRAVDTGNDSDGRFLRNRKCQGCGEKYTTVEIVIPDTPFRFIDVARKNYQKMWLRARRGFNGGWPRKVPFTVRLKVEMVIIRYEEHQGKRYIA